jgi:nucleotide-binding universal stress UspA family protein
MVPLDGSSFAEATLPFALGLASRWGASVSLVAVAAPEATGPEPRAPGTLGDDVVESARKQAKEYLVAVEDRIRAGGFGGDVTSKSVPAGNVWHALAGVVLEIEADFVVMSTHGLGPIKRAWLGSTADGFIRHSPVPVLLIRPDTSSDGASSEASELSVQPVYFRRALFPVDGSEASEHMLEVAQPLLEEDSECMLLRVSKAAWSYLDALAERSPCGVVITKVMTAAQPAVAILGAVEEEEADLIAISTAGRGGASRLLLGSVADKVIRGSAVPVLVSRAEADQS